MLNNSIFLLVGSSIFLGISNIFFQKSTKAIGAENTTLWYYVFGAVIAAAYSFFKANAVEYSITDLRWAFFTASTLIVSVYLFNFAIEDAKISIASTIRSMSFVVTIVLSISLGQEALSLKHFVGILLAVGAVICFK